MTVLRKAGDPVVIKNEEGDVVAGFLAEDFKDGLGYSALFDVSISAPFHTGISRARFNRNWWKILTPEEIVLCRDAMIQDAAKLEQKIRFLNSCVDVQGEEPSS